MSSALDLYGFKDVSFTSSILLYDVSNDGTLTLSDCPSCVSFDTDSQLLHIKDLAVGSTYRFTITFSLSASVATLDGELDWDSPSLAYSETSISENRTYTVTIVYGCQSL